MKACSSEGCEEPINARTSSGMCRLHYRRWWAREMKSDAAKERDREANRRHWKGKRRPDRFVREYGITLEQFDAMCAEQGGRCYLCGKFPPAEAVHPANRVLQMDHSHDTGENRRPLCHRCNKGLGIFDDDPDLLRRAAEYLCATTR